MYAISFILIVLSLDLSYSYLQSLTKFKLRSNCNHYSSLTESEKIITTNEVITLTTSITPIPNDNKLTNNIIYQFTQAWKQSLLGNNKDILNLISNPDTTPWDNPFVATTKEYLDGLKSFSTFFIQPSLTIINTKLLNTNTYELTYQLSFNYPMFWRPRIIIPATAILTIDNNTNKIIKIKEVWNKSVLELFIQQFFPRWWDIFHLFTTPSPEYPPIKVVGKSQDVEFIEIAPTLYIEVRWQGPSDLPGPPLQAIPVS